MQFDAWLKAQKKSDMKWEDIKYDLGILAKTVGDGPAGEIDYCNLAGEGVVVMVYPHNSTIGPYMVTVPYTVLYSEDPKQAARDLRHEKRMAVVEEDKEKRRKLYELLREEFEDDES